MRGYIFLSQALPVAWSKVKRIRDIFFLFSSSFFSLPLPYSLKKTPIAHPIEFHYSSPTA
jgi:hypothetical protein